MNSLSAELFLPLQPWDHTQGPAEAPVTLVLYGDHQCSFCCAACLTIRRVQQEMPRELLFAFRHFPMQEQHPLALRAAESTEAAGAQGKFWEMHELLCERNSQLLEHNFIQYAALLDLDLGRFQRDLRERVFLPKIEEHVQSGRRSGVDQVPAFFVNGRRTGEDWSRANLHRALLELLA